MIWFLVLGSIFNILSVIFYIIPHRFINTRKWLFAYGLFWLGIVSFIFMGIFGIFSWLYENENYAIEQSFFYGFGVVFIFFVSTILGVVGRLYLLRLDNRGETIDSRFFHATMFLVFLFVTPILLGAIQFLIALISA